MLLHNDYKGQISNLFKTDKLLIFVGLSLPILFGGFFLLPTGAHRDVMYIFLIPMLMLLIRDRHDLIKEVVKERFFWGVFFGFLIFMTLSVGWSDTAETGRYFEKGKLLFLISVPLLASFQVVRKVPLTAVLSIYSFVAMALLTAVYLLVTGDFYRDGHLQRLHGLGRAYNPVGAGLLYALAFLATISLRAETKSLLMVKPVVLSILGLIIFFANSRGAILALAVALIVYGFVFYKGFLNVKLVGKLVAGFVMTVTGIFYFFYEASFFQRADTGRLQIWQQAIEKIGEATIFGHGLASKFVFSYTTVENANVSQIGHAHSLYLSTALQGGIIGLALLIVMLGCSALKSYELQRKTGISWPLLFIVCGAVLGICDFGGYIINLSVEWVVFWWPAVIAMALLSGSHKEN